jgi:thiosulfate/3-mercaptopyruvate sulfurtransferase
MTAMALPLVLEPDDLERVLGDPGPLVVDLGTPESYARGHVPGAVHLEYARIIDGRRPAPGLLPDAAALGAAFSSIGLTPGRHVVAYDDEGGGRACRMLWTLDAIGHEGFSLLNGGLFSWANESHALSREYSAPRPSDYRIDAVRSGLADLDYVRTHLGEDDVVLLDARSPEEYSGAKRFAARGGHIPGAVNLNWTDTMDQARNLRFRSEPELRSMLAERGVAPDKEVIVYCQTHHRSAHAYIMLRALGYERVRGYPGSWSEWGNRPDTPVES